MSADKQTKSTSNASTSKACDSQPSANKTPTITTRTQLNESVYIETEFLSSTPLSSQLQTVDTIEQNVSNLPLFDFGVSFYHKQNYNRC